jgi:hypothetical protein
MKSRITTLVICLIALTVLTLPAQAACPPGPFPTQAQLLPMIVGDWSFGLAGFNTGAGVGFVGAVGTFNVSMGSTSRAPSVIQGIVQSTISINLNGTMYTVLLPVVGTAQVDVAGGCMSGTIQLASGTNPSTVRTVRYTLAAGGTKMHLVSTDNDGVVLSGTADRQ